MTNTDSRIFDPLNIVEYCAEQAARAYLRGLNRGKGIHPYEAQKVRDYWWRHFLRAAAWFLRHELPISGSVRAKMRLSRRKKKPYPNCYYRDADLPVYQQLQKQIRRWRLSKLNSEKITCEKIVGSLAQVSYGSLDRLDVITCLWDSNMTLSPLMCYTLAWGVGFDSQADSYFLAGLNQYLDDRQAFDRHCQWLPAVLRESAAKVIEAAKELPEKWPFEACRPSKVNESKRTAEAADTGVLVAPVVETQRRLVLRRSRKGKGK